MMKNYGVATPADGSAASSTRIKFFDGPLELNWSHCGATAEFLGDFFAGLAAGKKLDANEARHSIAYLANELLENAVKFRAPGEIALTASLEASAFKLQLSNKTAPETAARFETLLAEITSRDPGDLLIERIEANAADPEAGGSGLGLLTLMNDYGAELGWTLEQEKPDASVRIETFAALTLS
jgi:hypothetical protein